MINRNFRVAYLLFYAAQQDSDRLLESLERLLAAIRHPWDTTQTRLFCHIEKKEQGEKGNRQFVRMFIEQLRAGGMQELAFIKDDPRFLQLVADLDG